MVVEHIHARVFLMMASCFAGSLMDELQVILGERAANPRNTCVLLMVAVFRSVSMKTLSMSKSI